MRKMKQWQDRLGTGMTLLQMPASKKNRADVRKRDLRSAGSVTAAQIIHEAGFTAQKPLLLCGDIRRNYPVLRQMTKMAGKPFVIIGTRVDFTNSCLLDLPTDWDENTLRPNLPSGSGRITVTPSMYLDLKQCVSEWDSHYPVLCLGNGLQLDTELLNLLHAQNGYLLSTDSLYRSVRSVDGDKLTPSELLFSMSYILVSSIGSAAKELLTVIPSYEQEKLTNTLDFSGHGDSPYSSFRGGCCRNGLGFRLSQSRTVESKPILTQDELTRMQALHLSLLYNAETAGHWTANIKR